MHISLGMDTTAHTMALAIYSLAANPGIQKRAQREMDEFNATTGHGNGVVIPPYVEAVLKESMRKYPTASTGSYREVMDPKGYQLTPDIKLKQHDWILVSIYSLQNSERIWGKEAKRFKPERFLPGYDHTGSLLAETSSSAT